MIYAEWEDETGWWALEDEEALEALVVVEAEEDE